jgi:fructokinase
MSIKIGIDLGGTKIEIAALDDYNKILYRDRIPTDAIKGQKKVFDNIKHLYNKTINFFDGETHSLGIGIPGFISKKSGLLYHSTIDCHNELNIRNHFDSLFQRNYVIENDANCFVFAEAILGSGKNYSNIFGLIIGTGCGAGIVINNQLIKGHNNLAGEVGHSIIKINGRKCFCGKKGCMNAYISGSALERSIRMNTKKNISAEMFFNKKKLNSIEYKIKNDYFEFLKTSIINIINIIDPEVIILGGGLSNLDEIYDELKFSNKNSCFENVNIKTKILKNSLGDSSGVIGAALLGI